MSDCTCERCGKEPASAEIHHTDGKGTVIRVEKICKHCAFIVYRNSIFNGRLVL